MNLCNCKCGLLKAQRSRIMNNSILAAYGRILRALSSISKQLIINSSYLMFVSSSIYYLSRMTSLSSSLPFVSLITRSLSGLVSHQQPSHVTGVMRVSHSHSCHTLVWVLRIWWIRGIWRILSVPLYLWPRVPHRHTLHPSPRCRWKPGRWRENNQGMEVRKMETISDDTCFKFH